MKMFQHTAARRRLAVKTDVCIPIGSFNTQPPEGGWDLLLIPAYVLLVSTHSRPKAAGVRGVLLRDFDLVSTHSRPKAADIRTAHL